MSGGGGGIFDMLREGGIFALAVFGLGIFGTLVAFGCALGAVLVKKRGMAIAFAGLCFFIVVGLLAIGGMGTAFGNSNVEAALASVSPEDQARLAQAGYEMAKIPLNFALGFSVLPFLASIACAGLAFTKRSPA